VEEAEREREIKSERMKESTKGMLSAMVCVCVCVCVCGR
jgi:hypothetical protein